MSWKMKQKRVAGRLLYEYTPDSGPVKTFTRSEIFHLPGFGFDGLGGLHPIQYMRETLGLTLASQLFGSKFFEQGTTSSGVIESPNTLTNDAYSRMKSSWEDLHQGIENAHKVAILEEGSTFKPLTVEPEKAQFLETRKFQVTDTARYNRIPPHMLGDLERSTYSNIEHQGLEFVIYTMLPWLARWEQAVSLQLIPEEERKDYFAEFLVDALLRGDIKSRYEAYRIAREIGVYSANDIRERENENPIDGGDKYFVPLNWVPVEKAGENVLEDQQPPSGPRASRTARSATTRGRLASAYRPLFEDAFSRIVKIERSELNQALDRHLRQRDTDAFMAWVLTYYEELPPTIRSRTLPIYSSLAESVKAEIVEEIGGDEEFSDTDREFLSAYAETAAFRYARGSASQIRALIRNTTVDKLEESLRLRFAQWEERRPGKVALEETIRSGNALARAFYLSAGVMYLRWIARGSESCPYCQEMSGRIVGIQRPFALSGETFAGADKKLRVRRSVGHPPLHAGCTCQIVAG